MSSRPTLTTPLDNEIRIKTHLEDSTVSESSTYAVLETTDAKIFRDFVKILAGHFRSTFSKHFQVLFRDTDRMDDARYFDDQRHGHEH